MSETYSSTMFCRQFVSIPRKVLHRTGHVQFKVSRGGLLPKADRPGEGEIRSHARDGASVSNIYPKRTVSSTFHFQQSMNRFLMKANIPSTDMRMSMPRKCRFRQLHLKFRINKFGICQNVR